MVNHWVWFMVYGIGFTTLLTLPHKSDSSLDMNLPCQPQISKHVGLSSYLWSQFLVKWIVCPYLHIHDTYVYIHLYKYNWFFHTLLHAIAHVATGSHSAPVGCKIHVFRHPMRSLKRPALSAASNSNHALAGGLFSSNLQDLFSDWTTLAGSSH